MTRQPDDGYEANSAMNRKTDYSKLAKALCHLQAQVDNWRTLPADTPRLMHEAVEESIIQRFETAWDSLWKALRRYLRDEVGLAEVPNGPNPVLRLAHENGLLPSPIEQWLTYARLRVQTAHDYSHEKAQAALQYMDTFLQDANQLFIRLTGQTPDAYCA